MTQNGDTASHTRWKRNTRMAGSAKPVYGAAFAHGSPSALRPSDVAAAQSHYEGGRGSGSASITGTGGSNSSQSSLSAPKSRTTSPNRHTDAQMSLTDVAANATPPKPFLSTSSTLPSNSNTSNNTTNGSSANISKGSSAASFSSSPVATLDRGRKDRDGSRNPSKSPSRRATDTEDSKAAAEVLKLNNRIAKTEKFRTVLEQPNVDLAALRKLAWSGTPEEFRPATWQHLMGYLPCNMEHRQATLDRKRAEYNIMVEAAFGDNNSRLDKAIFHQIHIDIPRTNPNMPIYQNKIIQESLERILYCWAIRHPASGYVQGINDLVTPFFQVYILAYLHDLDKLEINAIPPETFAIVEADSFWCLSKLLDGIQDSYTDKQPGIIRQVGKLAELVARIDAPLAAHLQQQNVEFYQFAFRWMNCLLMRELSLKSVIRMWDTYMAEGPDGFSHFHVYVCAAFLVKWSSDLRKMDFPDIMMFLQSIPKRTCDWDEREMEILLSEAFMWKSLFDTTKHLSSGAPAFVPIK